MCKDCIQLIAHAVNGGFTAKSARDSHLVFNPPVLIEINKKKFPQFRPRKGSPTLKNFSSPRRPFYLLTYLRLLFRLASKTLV